MSGKPPPSPDPGVPVVWSEEVGAKVIALVTSGVPLYRVESHPDMPNSQTLYEWRDKYPEWATALARARRSRADRLADEGMALVDEPLDLSMDGKVASAGVSRQNNRANYRRWLAGALDPDTYADKGANVTVNVGTKIELGAILPDRPTQPDRELVVDAKVEPKPEG